MSEHTQMPMKVAAGGYIEDATGATIFRPMNTGDHFLRAEFTVRACNAYKDLRAACKKAIAEFNGIASELSPKLSLEIHNTVVYKDLQAAIKKTKI